MIHSRFMIEIRDRNDSYSIGLKFRIELELMFERLATNENRNFFRIGSESDFGMARNNSDLLELNSFPKRRFTRDL